MTENNTIAAVCFGEMLWDVLPDGPQPGGAPLNVAYHLTKLGVNTGIMSRVGADENGRRLEQLLDKWGIAKHLLQIDPEHVTSEVIARMDSRNEVSYEIVFPVAWDFISNTNSIKSQLDAQTYLVYGSLSSRNDESRNTLNELLECDAIKVFDINLRTPYIQKEQLFTLLKKADIVKFNQEELSLACRLFGGFFEAEADKVKFIQHEFNIPEIIVTKGAMGASYYNGDNVCNAAGFPVKVMDTIGSGDAFLAAFITNKCLEADPQTAIENAVAMGAFIASRKGGCPDYHIRDYLEFKQSISINQSK